MPIIEIKVTDESGKVLKQEEIQPKVKVSDDNSKGSEEGKSNRKSTSKSKKS